MTLVEGLESRAGVWLLLPSQLPVGFEVGEFTELPVFKRKCALSLMDRMLKRGMDLSLGKGRSMCMQFHKIFRTVQDTPDYP